MATTTNFGWETPDDTDLVKDGAAAMRTLGNSIDTSFVDLKGGTTGQILSKASNTDLDYTWVSPNPGDITGVTAGTGISGGGTSGDVTITNSMATAIDAKGDLIAGTGADAFSRLAVGTNDQVLTADSSTATGLKWASVSSSRTLAQIATGSLSGTTVSLSGLSSYDTIILQVEGVQTSTATDFTMRFNLNGSTSALADEIRYYLNPAATTASGFRSYGDWILGNNNSFKVKYNDGNNAWNYVFTNCKNAGYTNYQAISGYYNTASVTYANSMNGVWKSNAAISSIDITTVGGNTFNAGTYTIYGA